MGEKLGVYGRYYQSELTQASLVLADTALDSGIPTTVAAKHACNREVTPYWDARVVNCHKQMPFFVWSDKCSRIIWTEIPPSYELLPVKDDGIENWLLVNWEALRPEDYRAVMHFDKLLVPFRCVGQSLLKHWGLKTGSYVSLPWIARLPICKHSCLRAHPNVKVLFPLYDSQPQRADQAVFTLMERVLADVKQAYVTVAVGHRWSLSSRSILKQLSKRFGKRFIVVKLPTQAERLALFADSDLTVWASRFESFGHVGLQSIFMGTPVISWDMRPQNEFLVGWKNSVLVSCKTKDNWLGVPEVTSGYEEFGDTLISTLRDKALLAKMKQHTDHGLEARVAQFEEGWKELIK